MTFGVREGWKSRYVAAGAPGAGKITLLGALRERGCSVVRTAATDVVTAGQAAGVSEPWTAPSFCEDVLRLQMAPAGADAGCPGGALGPVSEEFSERQVLLVCPLGLIETTAVRRITLADASAFEAIHESTFRASDSTWSRSPRTRSVVGSRPSNRSLPRGDSALDRRTNRRGRRQARELSTARPENGGWCMFVQRRAPSTAVTTLEHEHPRDAADRGCVPAWGPRPDPGTGLPIPHQGLG